MASYVRKPYDFLVPDFTQACAASCRDRLLLTLALFSILFHFSFLHHGGVSARMTRTLAGISQTGISPTRCSTAVATIPVGRCAVLHRGGVQDRIDRDRNHSPSTTAVHSLVFAASQTIVILGEIRVQDEDQPEEARGWCLIEEICRRRYVEPESQRHLLSQIRRRIKKAVRQVAEDVPIPEFLESRRSVGVRIACPLKIERLNQRLKQSE